MNNYNMKNCEIIPNSKKHNLSELSISQIWENKLADESSDYQQERFLINTIRESKKDVQNQYGLTFSRPLHEKTASHKVFKKVEIKEDPESQKSSNEPINSLDRNSALAFNKQIKRKKSYSKEKNPYCSKSSKLLITKPVPHVHQHYFKSPTDRQMRSPRNRQASKINSPLQITLQKNRTKIMTNLYQVPLRTPKMKDANPTYKELYHLLNDEIKVQVNDYNCQLIRELCKGIEKTQLQSQSPSGTIKMRQYQKKESMKVYKNSQFTNMNSTESPSQQASWLCSGSSENSQVFQILKHKSLDHRTDSGFSSCKTDRNAEFSPFSQDSNRTSKIHQQKHSNSNQISRNIIQRQQTKYAKQSTIQQNKKNVYYFVNGNSQDPSRNIIFSP